MKKMWELLGVLAIGIVVWEYSKKRMDSTQLGNGTGVSGAPNDGLGGGRFKMNGWGMF